VAFVIVELVRAIGTALGKSAGSPTAG
jgi:hypothetical protein